MIAGLGKVNSLHLSVTVYLICGNYYLIHANVYHSSLVFPQAAELVALNVEKYQDQMLVVRDYLEDSLQVSYIQTELCVVIKK